MNRLNLSTIASDDEISIEESSDEEIENKSNGFSFDFDDGTLRSIGINQLDSDESDSNSNDSSEEDDNDDDDNDDEGEEKEQEQEEDNVRAMPHADQRAKRALQKQQKGIEMKKSKQKKTSKDEEDDDDDDDKSVHGDNDNDNDNQRNSDEDSDEDSDENPQDNDIKELLNTNSSDEASSDELKNLCMECGIDMGPNNPRQLCGKTECLYPPKDPQSKTTHSEYTQPKKKQKIEM